VPRESREIIVAALVVVVVNDGDGLVVDGDVDIGDFVVDGRNQVNAGDLRNLFNQLWRLPRGVRKRSAAVTK
jgi:hypothetical protein